MTEATPAGVILRQMRQLPVADLDEIAPSATLILAPHPDDETLGCGGLAIQCCARGRPPLIVAVTDGAASHPACPPDRLAALRAAELRAAARILGIPERHVHFLGLPDSHAPCDGPDFEQAVHAVLALIRGHGIGTLLTTWPQDPHRDHQASACIGAVAARISGVRLLYFPVWGWLLPFAQMLPIAGVRGMRLDVAACREQKRRALAAHATQYSALLAGDPGGFRLPADLLAATDRDEEVFLEA